MEIDQISWDVLHDELRATEAKLRATEAKLRAIEARAQEKYNEGYHDLAIYILTGEIR